MNGKVSRIAIALVLLMCAGLYVVGNGRVALWDRDEPRYALASRWMAEKGDWVVPRVGWGDKPQTPRTAKPAGIYWCQAAAMRVLGVNEFAARLPSAVATTTLLAGLAIVIGRYVGTARAFWTVLVLGTSAMVVVASKMCVTDTVLLLWITAGQVCLLAIYRGTRSVKVAAGLWVAIALAGLTKGPVGLGVSAMTLLVLGALDALELWRRGERVSLRNVIAWWRWTRPLMGVAILAVVAGPWLWMVQRREPNFLSAAVSHDVIERMKTGLEEHTGPPGFYIATLMGTFFPWSLLLPLTFIIAWGRMRRRKDIRFALAAVIGPWIMMELVRTKLVHYVLPIFPPMAYLVGDAILRGLRGRHDGLVNGASRLGAGLWAAVVVAAAALPWLAARYYAPVPTAAMAVLTGIGVIYGIWVLIAFWRKRTVAGLVGMGVGFAAFCAVAFGWVLPEAEFMRLPSRVAAELVAEGATKPGDAWMIGFKEQSLAWYQGGTIDEVWANRLTEGTVESWPQWVVVTPKLLEPVAGEKRRWLTKVAEFRGLNYASGRWMDVWVMRKREPVASDQ